MKLWPILLVAACLLAGCAPRAEPRRDGAPPVGKTPSGAQPSKLEVQLYGRWVGAKSEPKAGDPKPKPNKNSAGQPNMSNSLANMVGGYSIDLKSDYSFRMDMAGTNLDGTWELKGDEVRMTVEHVMGKTKAEYSEATSDVEKELATFFEKPPSAKVRDSGKRLAVPHEAAKGIIFTKES